MLRPHERARIAVGELARRLGETRWAMTRWLRLEGCPIQQGGPRRRQYVLTSELRVWAPMVWRALAEMESEGAAGGT